MSAIVRRTVLVACATALALSGCVGQHAVDATGDGTRFIAGAGTLRSYPNEQRKEAPSLAGTTLDGAQLALSDLRGDVVVVNFWAAWCAPCRDEAAGLAQLSRDTRQSGVRFVGVNFRDDDANARAFVRTHATPYPSIVDRYSRAAGRWRVYSVPSTFVLDRAGRIAAAAFGSVTYGVLRPVVESVAAVT